MSGRAQLEFPVSLPPQIAEYSLHTVHSLQTNFRPMAWKIKPATALRCRRSKMWMIKNKPGVLGPGCSRVANLWDYSKRQTVAHLSVKPKHIALSVTWDVQWGALTLRRLGRSWDWKMSIWSAGWGGLMVLRRWANRPISSSDGPRISIFLYLVISSIWWSCPIWEALIWRAELQWLTLETAIAPAFVVDIGPRDSLCSQSSAWQSSYHCCQLLSYSSGMTFWKSWPITATQLVF